MQEQHGFVSLHAEPEWRSALPIEPESDPYAGAELEIEDEFRRQCAALRRLPKRDRAAALRNARESRQLALRLLQERRAQARQARRALHLMQRPRPG